MSLTTLVSRVRERDEVGDIFRSDGSPLLLGQTKESGILQCAQLRTLGDGSNVIATMAQLLGDRGGIHLVQH